MRRSLLGSNGWFGSVYSSRLPLPLVSRMNGVQPCDFCSSPVSSNIFCVEPADDRRLRAAGAGPQRLIGVRGEVQMVPREAGADQREFPARRIIHRQIAVRLLQWEDLRRGMARPLFAEIWVCRGAHSGGEPDPSLL